MQIDVGYFYFIKDSFFDIIDDPELMKNKENGNKRPCYYCIKSKKYDNIIWFIPRGARHVDFFVYNPLDITRQHISANTAIFL